MKRLKHEDCTCDEGKIRCRATFRIQECKDCDYNMTERELDAEAESDAYDLVEAEWKGN